MSAGVLLGMVEVTERGGRLVAQLPVTQWPATLGRSLAADLVVEDPHLAAEHLRIDRGENGTVQVHVLETVNGISLGRRRHAAGESFDWPVGEELLLGRLHFTMRLADAPLAPEQPLPSFPWRAAAITAGILVALLGYELSMAWIQSVEPGAWGKSIVDVVATVALGVAGWAALWALLSKLFSGQAYFWRHVRIVGAGILLARVAYGLAHVLAFSFSLESLARFSAYIFIVGLAVIVYLHLRVVAPRRKAGLGIALAVCLLVGIPAKLGSNWLQNKRFSEELYMASIFPPSWRMAPAVPAKDFLAESASLKEKLDARVKDKENEDAGFEDDAEE
ncbi:MAG: FHA domain-containing protein [Burkholderiaceae bacterium]